MLRRCLYALVLALVMFMLVGTVVPVGGQSTNNAIYLPMINQPASVATYEVSLIKTGFYQHVAHEWVGEVRGCLRVVFQVPFGTAKVSGNVVGQIYLSQANGSDIKIGQDIYNGFNIEAFSIANPETLVICLGPYDYGGDTVPGVNLTIKY